MAGYHLADIEKGVYGQPSKIFEEVAEFKDALEQRNPVMELCELSDLVGAIKGYLSNRYGGTVTLSDLDVMAEATEKAFKSGRRA